MKDEKEMDPTLANLLHETQAPHFDMRVAAARLAWGLPWESRPGVHFGDRLHDGEAIGR